MTALISPASPSPSELPIALLEESFGWIKERERFAELFYARLFEQNPDIHALFQERGTAMPKQQDALMEMLAVLMRLLKKGDMESLQTLYTAARTLGRKHQEYGVQPEWFDTVGTTLLDTFPAYLAECGEAARWTEPYRTAWAQGYEAIASLMLLGYEEEPTEPLHL